MLLFLINKCNKQYITVKIVICQGILMYLTIFLEKDKKHGHG